jgi:glycosyltransferase involved in cell wall biosynthesis
MRVFSLATGQDLAGIGVRMAQAFARHAPGWEYRATASSTPYIDYPIDVPYRQRDAERLYDAADVIHLHGNLQGHEWYDDGQGKPTILEHHGTEFRWYHGRLARQARRIGAVQVASTLDLTMLERGIEWAPAPYNLDELRAIRAEHYIPTDKIRIAHAPTNREVKSTGYFLDAMRSLARTHPVELILIEGRAWSKCLALKAKADLFYDQVQLGYGCNAIEAWAMGIPVIAGVEDPDVKAVMAQRWDGLPFYEATEDTIYDALRTLVESEQARREWAERGTRHVERFHRDDRVVPLLQDLYRNARATLPGGNAKRKTQRLAAVAA